ncbi:hypothetical protein K449DRAFT_233995 [Hypoxylon sp. EC38]|nr:hypothetical protein K449DRAFT_233995 [Hypoxylon sp. EC38]
MLGNVSNRFLEEHGEPNIYSPNSRTTANKIFSRRSGPGLLQALEARRKDMVFMLFILFLTTEAINFHRGACKRDRDAAAACAHPFRLITRLGWVVLFLNQQRGLTARTTLARLPVLLNKHSPTVEKKKKKKLDSTAMLQRLVMQRLTPSVPKSACEWNISNLVRVQGQVPGSHLLEWRIGPNKCV